MGFTISWAALQAPPALWMGPRQLRLVLALWGTPPSFIAIQSNLELAFNIHFAICVTF